MTDTPEELAARLEEALARRLAARRRRAFALARRFRLDRHERIEFAVALTGREVDSWNDLTYDEIRDVVTGLEGAALCLWLLSQRKGRYSQEVHR